jgi:AraC-like DNA-binding protein
MAWRFELISLPTSSHEPEDRFEALPQWSTDLHFIHTLEGSGTLRVGHRRIESHPGVVLVVPPFEHCSWRKVAGHRWRMINIHVGLRDEQGRALHELPFMPDQLVPEGLEAIHQRLERCASGLAGEDPRAAMVAASDAVSLAASYVAQFARDLETLTQSGMDHRVRRMQVFLREAAGGAYPSSAVASVAGLSASQAVRLFRAETGVTPKMFWRRHRLGLSQGLLASTSRSIKTIATDLGFSDVYYFSRWFTQNAGLTPTAFRRMHREI